MIAIPAQTWRKVPTRPLWIGNLIMMNADENTSIAGSGQRNGRTENPGKKAEKKRRKPVQPLAPKPEAKSEALPSDVLPSDVLLESPEPAQAMPAPVDQPVAFTEAPAPVERAAESAPSEPATTAESPVSLQSLAEAYGSYTSKSFEQTTSLIGQLAGTRSLSRAIELQTEFARIAFETFVTESRKIRELHRELAKQRLNSLEGLVMGRSARRSS